MPTTTKVSFLVIESCAMNIVADKGRFISITTSGVVDAATFSTNLTRFKKRTASELNVSEDSSIFDFASEIAYRICEAITCSRDNSLSFEDTKKEVKKAAKVGGISLLGPKSLNGWDAAKIYSYANDTPFWSSRILGEIRTVLSGIKKGKDIKRAIAHILKHEPTLIAGVSGYKRVATLFCQGNMSKAFKLVSALCKTHEIPFTNLNWGSLFPGSVREFTVFGKLLKAQFEDINNSPYLGTKGYKDFANTFTNRDMQKAFMLVSALCKVHKLPFARLNWGSAFLGTTEEFTTLENLLKEQFKDIETSHFLGSNGYKDFAKTYTNGDMKKAFMLVSALFKAHALPFAQLNWGSAFFGTTAEFTTLENLLKEQYKDIENSRFVGSNGYKYFAKTYTNGDMKKAYMLVSALCKANGFTFADLQWGICFHGSTDKFDEQANRSD